MDDRDPPTENLRSTVPAARGSGPIDASELAEKTLFTELGMMVDTPQKRGLVESLERYEAALK